jgi:hypothetical protein
MLISQGLTVFKHNKFHFHTKVYFPYSTLYFMYFECVF